MVKLLFLRLLWVCKTILNPWTFTVAPDPRCKLERVGSVAFVCLRGMSCAIK